MAKLLPIRDPSHSLSEEQISEVAALIHVPMDEAKKWALGVPITIPEPVDALFITQKLNVPVYITRSVTILAGEVYTVYRTYDTFQIVDPPATIDVCWQTLKLPSDKEYISTLAICYYFSITNRGDEPCVLTVRHGYWPGGKREATSHYDGVTYIDGWLIEGAV